MRSPRRKRHICLCLQREHCCCPRSPGMLWLVAIAGTKEVYMRTQGYVPVPAIHTYGWLEIHMLWQRSSLLFYRDCPEMNVGSNWGVSRCSHDQVWCTGATQQLGWFHAPVVPIHKATGNTSTQLSPSLQEKFVSELQRQLAAGIILFLFGLNGPRAVNLIASIHAASKLRVFPLT